MQVVSIKETSKDVWRVTFDGKIRGDSQGYSHTRAIAEAKTIVRDEMRWANRDNRPIEFTLDATLT